MISCIRKQRPLSSIVSAQLSKKFVSVSIVLAFHENNSVLNDD